MEMIFARADAIERDVEQFLDRIAQAQLPAIITACENRIRGLAERKIEIGERIASCGRPLRSFDETPGTSLDFPADLGNLLALECPEHKKAVLKPVFVGRGGLCLRRGLWDSRSRLAFQGIGRYWKLQRQIGAPGGRNFELFARNARSL